MNCFLKSNEIDNFFKYNDCIYIDNNLIEMNSQKLKPLAHKKVVNGEIKAQVPETKVLVKKMSPGTPMEKKPSQVVEK